MGTLDRAPEDVLLATCSDRPDGEPGGDLLVDALGGHGLTARWAPWDAAEVDWGSARAVVVRSTWDYESRLPEFLAWARGVGIGLVNGAEVLAWNVDKGYLVALDDAGLPVVPTLVARTQAEVGAVVGDGGATVAKPVVGASGRGVVVLERPEHVGRLAGPGPWIVQPLVGSVRTEGETSVFVFGGVAAAQVRKVPAAGGGILVHEEHGGSATAVPLEPEHRALATRAVAVAEDLLATRLTYARVDLMRLADGTLAVGELEVTEPGFYLDVVPDNAAAFAAALAAALD